jgi:hypothetical protein
VLQIQNLERPLCRAKGLNKHKTGTSILHDRTTLSYGFYNISLTTTGKFAAKSNDKGEEETRFKID